MQEKFFLEKRHQQMSAACDKDNNKNNEEIEDNDDIVDEAFFPCHHEITVEIPAGKTTPTSGLADEEFKNISVGALELDDAQIADGRVDGEEEELDDDVFKDVELPSFDEDQLQRIGELQDDDILRECRVLLKDDAVLPTKLEAMARSVDVRKFLRHRSLFRESAQGVLMRMWTNQREEIAKLIVVGEGGFERLMKQHHGFDPASPSMISHLGMRKTMLALSDKFYAFGMRKKVNAFINSCPECKMNNSPSTRPEKDGNQMRSEENSMVVMDLLGPVNSLGNNPMSPQYVCLMIDAVSKYVCTYVTRSTGDNDIFRSVSHLRESLAGLPKRIQVDNALLSKHSKTRKYLESMGVRIYHGLAYVSRCQSLAEKAIGTLSTLVRKLHTSAPETPFSSLIREATMVMNNSPHESLPAGMSPKDVHFVRPTTSFLHFDPDTPVVAPKSITSAIRTAQKAAMSVLDFQVKAALKRKEEESPQDQARKLRIGDLVLKKRTSFAKNVVKKTSHKLTIDAFIVVARIATNSYRVRSLMNEAIFCFPGDHLIRVSHLDEEGMRRLVRSMEASAARSLPVPSRPRTRARAAMEVNCVRRFITPTEEEEESTVFLAESQVGTQMS